MSGYYKIEDYQNDRFDQLPKALRKGKYKGLSNNARVLYAVLKDRNELSVKNRWVDDQGRIFFYFTQEELSAECCISKSTVFRAMKDLEEMELVVNVQQGLNMANRLYLCKPDVVEELINNVSQAADFNENKKPANNQQKPEKAKEKEQEVGNSQTSQIDNSRTSQIDNSRLVKMTVLDRSKRLTNKTEDNKTKESNTINQNHIISTESTKTSICEYFKKQIDYDLIRYDSPEREEVLNELVRIAVDVLTSTAVTIRVNKEDKPVEVVKSQFAKLNQMHILYVLDSLTETSKKFTNPTAVIKTSLYNAVNTISTHYTNLVQTQTRRGGEHR